MLNILKTISSNPKYLLISYIISLGLSTLIFCFIENQTLLDSFYWSCITSLTIGYGDFSPSTNIGKVFTIFISHFWIFFIIPSVISHILANLIQNRNEFTHEEQEEIKTLLRNLSKNF